MPVHIQATQDISATQAYAQQCWQDNPSIIPSWWRGFVGNTVGKQALDCRHGLPNPHHLATGHNLLLTSPATHTAVQSMLGQTSNPQVYVTVLITPAPAAHLKHSPHVMVWEIITPPEPEEIAATLAALEEAVSKGALQAYGILDPFLGEPTPRYPLHEWLSQASSAAQSIYGRRKRPALEVVITELDLLNLSTLTTANTLHKEQSISPLELAARLNLAMIALPLAMPADVPPAGQALQALTTLAKAEASISPWPTHQGLPLFSALAALKQGQSPWPTPHHWQSFARSLLPLHRQSFASYPAYLQALENLLPYGEPLSQAAVQPILASFLKVLANRLSPPWATLPPTALAEVFISSLPGVTALASISPENTQILQKYGDFPDPGILFTL